MSGGMKQNQKKSINGGINKQHRDSMGEIQQQQQQQ